MNKCTSCDTEILAGHGVCAACGAVYLRSNRWESGDPYSAAGMTPLIRSTVPELRGTFLKVEGAHPSGSFKERVMAVLVREAVASGARAAVVASSGNAAVAAATHCARAGLPLLVLVPRSVPPEIITMVNLRGAALLRVGEGPAAVHGLAHRLTSLGFANLASTFAASGCEWACRGIGHEIAQQMGDSPVATVAAAISVGPVLIGTANGIRETGRPLPRIVGGQAAGCSPIARAYSRSQPVAPWEDEVDTKASSIADRLTGYAAEADFLISRVRENGGHVGAGTDAELRRLRTDLAHHDGLDVELSSCAALFALIESGRAGRDAVAVLTGAGLRETLRPGVPAAEPFPVDELWQSAQLSPTEMQEVEQWITESR